MFILHFEELDIECELPDGAIALGRDDENEICVVDERVSGRHAEFACRGGTLIIRDLGSSNGTWLNGVAVVETELHAGDRLRFGEVTCLVREEVASAGAPVAEIPDRETEVTEPDRKPKYNTGAAGAARGEVGIEPEEIGDAAREEWAIVEPAGIADPVVEVVTAAAVDAESATRSGDDAERPAALPAGARPGGTVAELRGGIMAAPESATDAAGAAISITKVEAAIEPALPAAAPERSVDEATVEPASISAKAEIETAAVARDAPAETSPSTEAACVLEPQSEPAINSPLEPLVAVLKVPPAPEPKPSRKRQTKCALPPPGDAVIEPLRESLAETRNAVLAEPEAIAPTAELPAIATTDVAAAVEVPAAVEASQRIADVPGAPLGIETRASEAAALEMLAEVSREDVLEPEPIASTAEPALLTTEAEAARPLAEERQVSVAAAESGTPTQPIVAEPAIAQTPPLTTIHAGAEAVSDSTTTAAPPIAADEHLPEPITPATFVPEPARKYAFRPQPRRAVEPRPLARVAKPAGKPDARELPATLPPPSGEQQVQSGPHPQSVPAPVATPPDRSASAAQPGVAPVTPATSAVQPLRFGVVGSGAVAKSHFPHAAVSPYPAPAAVPQRDPWQRRVEIYIRSITNPTSWNRQQAVRFFLVVTLVVAAVAVVWHLRAGAIAGGANVDPETLPTDDARQQFFEAQGGLDLEATEARKKSWETRLSGLHAIYGEVPPASKRQRRREESIIRTLEAERAKLPPEGADARRITDAIRMMHEQGYGDANLPR
jgi:hypothetical protein